MSPHRKLIEYYFYHYDERYETCSKRQVEFQNAMYILNTGLFHDIISSKTSEDAIALIMSKVFEKTYQHFRGKKRALIKSRYYYKHKRPTTCKSLSLSYRTYHRYLEEILMFAEDVLVNLVLAQHEYEKQKTASLLEIDNLTVNHEYLSNYQ